MLQEMLPLFDEPSRGFHRERLAEKLRELASENVLIGTSSWKYEGWIGQVYTAAPYMVRGRFSQRRFEQTCIAEYAKTFPVVCGDFLFYQFPPDEFWRKLFTTAPPELKFAFKVPEDITVKTFPGHPRYGPRVGQENPSYLDFILLDAALLRALEPYRERIALLIFEFGTFSKKSYEQPAQFYTDLDEFLSRTPRGWRYAVEVRNEEFLEKAYFDVLHKHGVAHVFSSWTRMPPLYKQVEIAEAYTSDFTVVRALLRSGRTYEEAVKLFSPYERVQDENPKTRAAMKGIIERARRKREPAYLFINNRLEGNAPVTINAITDAGAVDPEEA